MFVAHIPPSFSGASQHPTRDGVHWDVGCDFRSWSWEHIVEQTPLGCKCPTKHPGEDRHPGWFNKDVNSLMFDGKNVCVCAHVCFITLVTHSSPLRALNGNLTLLATMPDECGIVALWHCGNLNDNLTLLATMPDWWAFDDSSYCHFQEFTRKNSAVRPPCASCSQLPIRGSSPIVGLGTRHQGRSSKQQSVRRFLG